MPKVRGNQIFSRNLSAIFFSAHKLSREAMRPRERLSWLVSENKSYLSFIFLIAAIKITIYVKQTSAGEKFGNLCENHNKTFFLKRRSFFFVRDWVSTGWKYLFSLFCKQFELEILSMHSICFEIYLNFPDLCFKVCFVFVHLQITSKQPGLNGFSTERVEKPRNFHFQCQRDEEGRRNAAQVRERDGRNVTQRKRDANSREYHASEEWFNFVFLLLCRHSVFSGR